MVTLKSNIDKRQTVHDFKFNSVFDLIPKNLLDDYIGFSVAYSTKFTVKKVIDHISSLFYDGSEHFFSALRVVMESLPNVCQLDWDMVNSSINHNCAVKFWVATDIGQHNTKTLCFTNGSTLIIASEYDPELSTRDVYLFVVPYETIDKVTECIELHTVKYRRYIQCPNSAEPDPYLKELLQRLTEITRDLGKYTENAGGEKTYAENQSQ